MPSFTYRARDDSGTTVSGSIEAVSRKAAVQKLSAKRLRPVTVKETGEAAEAEKKSESDWRKHFSIGSKSKEVKEKDLGRAIALPFLRALKELLNCGIQAGDGLRMMSVRLSDPKQKLLATKLWDELRQGRSLSEALHKFPKVFSESVVSLVEAGEATGSLNGVLSRIVTNMEERKEINAKIVSALAYPAFLILIALGLVLLFLFSLLPRIQGLLSSLGGKLPASTRILIAFADFLVNYGWLAALGTIVAVVSIMSWRNTEKGRPKFDALILKIPGLGIFMRDLQVLQLTQTLSLLLENGITMVQSLTMTERSVSNRSMRESFVEARGRVTEGVSLSSAFKGTGYFDDMALDIFTVGENTGDVVPGLKQMARQYAVSIDKTVRRFLGFISTGVLLGVFGFVGLIAIGIISAVFQLSSSLSGG